MWVMGSNACGQLGTGDKQDRNVPVQVNISPAKCAAGSNHTLALCGNKVFGTGDNSHGQLSIPQKEVYEFKEVYEADNIVDIFCGWNSSYITTREMILASGENSFGALGIEAKKVSCFTPIMLKDTIKISTGMRHTLFLSGSGQVYGCGTTRQGTLSLHRNDIVWNPIKLFDNAVDIACGQFHSMILTNGKVYGFGRNKFGQLKGDFQFTVDPFEIQLQGVPKSIFSNWSTSAALSNKGLELWGRNDFGQCAGSLDSIIDPLNINQMQLAFGSEHTLLLFKDKVYTWGWNEHGNCGNGTNLNIYIPFLLPMVAKGVCCGGGHSILF